MRHIAHYTLRALLTGMARSSILDRQRAGEITVTRYKRGEAVSSEVVAANPEEREAKTHGKHMAYHRRGVSK